MMGTGTIAVNKHDHYPPRTYYLVGEDKGIISHKWMHGFKNVEDAMNKNERDMVWFETSEKASMRKWYQHLKDE